MGEKMNKDHTKTTMNIKNKVNSRLARSMTLLLVMTVILAACGSSGKNNQAVQSITRDEAGSLKVAYTNEDNFYMQYGNAYNAMFPNVAVEVISTESIWNADDPAAELKKLVEEQKPDVISLTEDQYQILAAEGYLYDLDTVIKQDQFDVDKVMPGVIDLLKTKGGGKLYGLSPNFSSQALYYNKDMFDKHKVPYPTDQMSWEELLQLAERFPTEGTGDEQTYGLVVSGSTPFDLVETMGTAKGLTYVDYDSGKLSMNTDEWKSIIETVTNSYKSGKVLIPRASDTGGGGLSIMRKAGGNAVSINMSTMNFAAGKAAMTIDQSFLMNMLEMSQRMGRNVKGGKGGAVSATRETGKGDKMLEIQEINWDLVTIPVDPTNPDVTGGLSLDTIWSINAASENLGPAWELVKYVNGDQLAKTTSKSSPQLTSRTDYISSEEHNLKAFTGLSPNPITFAQKFPSEFKSEFAALASEEMKQIISSSKTVADALQVIQTKGQDLLTQKKLAEQ
jgi:multiple sugar transport system substrate-binding protein